MNTSIAARAMLAALLVALPLDAAAQSIHDSTTTTDRAASSLHGTLIDAATQEPVASAAVRLLESGRTDISHADGSFHFNDITPGPHTIAVERIGYAPLEQRVSVTASVTGVRLALRPTALDIAAIVVTGTGSERSADASYRPVTVLSDADLRRNLGGSIAATLAGQPGLTQRYNGPVAAQPVLRGLSGDRVLVLEDGARTGDLAVTAADHAVTIEPLTAERIEIVRGPAGILYGSNSLGGVINVIREEVPRSVPEHWTGTATAQLESVNSGATAGGALTTGIGGFAVRAELSGRTAGDTHTPEGELPGTSLDGWNAGAGLSGVWQSGHAGMALRDYGVRYGVPGLFNGSVIPGGHADGVEIEARRTTARAEARLTGAGNLRALEADLSAVRFEQREFEMHDGGRLLGTHFRQYSANGNVRLHHRHSPGGVRVEGAVGVSGGYRDLEVGGARSGSWPAQHYSAAVYAFEELARNPFSIELGGRYDWTRIDPVVASDDAGDVRSREFGSLSGSAALLYRPDDVFSIGVSIARSFRTPSIEELFSEGPHLANYSYDIGNPELDAEYGFGIDVFVRANAPTLQAELAVFRNAISDFIYQAPTGEKDPRLGQYPVYRATQGDALLVGADARVQWEPLSGWVLDATGSYVRGRRTHADSADVDLPAMPPLHGTVELRREASRWFAGLGVQGAAQQDRTGKLEMSTSAHALIDAMAGLRWNAFGRLNTLTLRAHNVLDTAWRDHLSRIRTVAPQPGRNVQLLYRITI